VGVELLQTDRRREMGELTVAFRFCFADTLNKIRKICFIYSAFSETNGWIFFFAVLSM